MQEGRERRVHDLQGISSDSDSGGDFDRSGLHFRQLAVSLSGSFVVDDLQLAVGGC